HRCGPSVQVHEAPEQLDPPQGDVVGDADEADVPAGPRRADRRHHRLLRADRLDDRVRAYAGGELLDPTHALVAAVTDHVERAVSKRDAEQLGLRSQGSHGYAIDAAGLVAGATDLARVVGGPEGTDHELARLDRPDVATDLLDDPDVLVTHRSGPRERLDPS